MRRFTARKTAAPMIAVPCTTGKSRPSTACTARRPIPGHAKMVSTTTAPPSIRPKSIPSTVITGSVAFRSTCFRRTARPPSPFARAVRTKSCASTSSRLVRVSRLIWAA